MAVNDIIDHDRYNRLQNRVATILGTGSGASGYGQTLASAQVAQGDTIEAVHMENLRDDMNSLSVHQSGSTITTIAEILSGDIIADDNNGTDTPNVTPADGALKGMADYEAAMTPLEENKDVIFESTQLEGPITPNPDPQEERTTAWNNVLVHQGKISFTTYDQRRFFFNSGGAIRFDADITNGTAGTKQEGWYLMFQSMGIIKFKSTETTNTGTSGTAYSIGNNDILLYNDPSAPAGPAHGNFPGGYLIFEKGGGTGTVYEENSYLIWIRAFDSKTLEYRIEFRDDDTGDQTGIGGPVDEDVQPVTNSIITYERSKGAVIFDDNNITFTSDYWDQVDGI
jgi:hypothetical protein